VRLGPGQAGNVEVSMRSGLVLPALPHSDGHADGILACRSNSAFGGVEAPALADAHVLAVDCDQSVQTLKTPDSNSDVNELLVGKFVDTAVEPRPNQEESNAELVGSQKDLVVGMPQRRKGESYEQEQCDLGLPRGVSRVRALVSLVEGKPTMRPIWRKADPLTAATTPAQSAWSTWFTVQAPM